jgi:hypothetical protein
VIEINNELDKEFLERTSMAIDKLNKARRDKKDIKKAEDEYWSISAERTKRFNEKIGLAPRIMVQTPPSISIDYSAPSSTGREVYQLVTYRDPITGRKFDHYEWVTKQR